MARLHASRRPIVVSFRRHHTQQQDSTADTELSGGSTSTGPEVYVSLEELTKNSSRFNSRKSSKSKKTRNKLNETCLSVICKHSNPTCTGIRDRTVKEGNDKEDTFSGFTSSSNSSFRFSSSHDNQSKDMLVPSWYIENESSVCLPLNIDVKMSKEMALIKNNTENPTHNDTENLGAFKNSVKYPKVEDIEIFQEQHLKIQSSIKKSQRNSKRNRHHSKTQNEPNTIPNNTDYYFEKTRRLNVRFDEFQNDKKNTRRNTINGMPQSVPRSSTLPSFRSATSDTDARVVDLSVHSLKYSTFFETSHDIANRGKLAGEVHRFRSSTQLSDRTTNEGCTGPYTSDSNTTSASESYVKCNVISHRKKEQNLSDMTEIPICEVCTPAKNIFNDGFNSKVTHGAQSALETKTKQLLREDEIQDENNKIQISIPKIHCVEKEILNERFDIRSESERKQNKAVEHPQLSSQNNILPPNTVATVSTEKCDTHTRAPVCGKTAVMEKECIKYMSETTIYDFTVSMPFCNSRPKSCTDLTLPAHVSIRQNCELFTSALYSSSPRLATCDLAL